MGAFFLLSYFTRSSHPTRHSRVLFVLLYRLNQEEGLKCLYTNITSVIDSLALIEVVMFIKVHDPWLNRCIINLRRKWDTALRYYLGAKANNPHFEKSFKKSLRPYAMTSTHSTVARDSFMQTKISHVLDTNKNGVCCELRNIGLLPQQREELLHIYNCE